MTVQLSDSARDGANDAFETAAGATAKLRILSGAQPADCSTAESGVLAIEITLPSDWMGASSAGVKALAGSWSDTATGTQTAGYFRIVDNAGTTCHMQGSVGQGSGDLSLDNTSIATGQTVTISTFSLTAGNP